MELVNSLGGTLNRNALADPSSSSEAGGSKAGVKSATDVSTAILDIFKCSLVEAESYLATFEARLKLEEDYVRGLKVLSDKSKDSMLKLDSRIASSMYIDSGGAQLPRARQAWKVLREDYLREIDARMHYVETLRQGVIAPLTVYRDGQERIRKRVKEDLKMSIGRYDEMRNSTLPRARKTYEKRCDEVEQMRLQQQAIEDQRALLNPATMNMSREASGQGSARDISSPTVSSGPSEGEEEHVGQDFGETSTASPQRSLSARRAQAHGRKESRTSSTGVSESGPKAISSATSTGPSPRMSSDAPLSLSPGEKKGHFLDALRSRENWEAARKEAPKKLNALLNRMREGGQGGGSERGEGGLLSTSPHSDRGEAGTGGAGTALGGLGIALGGGPGSVKSTQNMALKNVKAKREADEADQAYRKVTFDLETLRLRREKTVSAALASAVESRKELYLTCQAVWMQSERSNQVLTKSQLGMSEHASQMLETSLDTLDQELHLVESRVPSLAEVDEGKMPYVNYYFGECKDLLFGVSLIDYAFSRAQHSAPSLGPGKVEAPVIVQKCIAFVEERALTQAGIYRISAKHSAIQNLAHALERDEERFEFHPTNDEPATVAGVLKLYLRQLPDAVMPIPWEERVKYTHERQEQIQTGFAALKGRIRRLPPINQATLKIIVEHLAKVASHAEQNKMNVSNLSIVFGPLLLSQADHETTSIAAAMEEDRVTEDLILYAHDIFDLTHAGAPVLPPISTTTNTEKGELDVGVMRSATSLETEKEAEAVTISPSDVPLTSGNNLRRSNAIAAPFPESNQQHIPRSDAAQAPDIPAESKQEASEQEASTAKGDAAVTKMSDGEEDAAAAPHVGVPHGQGTPASASEMYDP